MRGDCDSGLVINSATPAYILEDFSTHLDFDIRGFVTDNPNTPLYVIKELLSDPVEWVRGRAKKI